MINVICLQRNDTAFQYTHVNWYFMYKDLKLKTFQTFLSLKPISKWLQLIIYACSALLICVFKVQSDHLWIRDGALILLHFYKWVCSIVEIKSLVFVTILRRSGGENAIKFDIYVKYNSLTHGTISSVVVELTLERGTL